MKIPLQWLRENPEHWHQLLALAEVSGCGGFIRVDAADVRHIVGVDAATVLAAADINKAGVNLRSIFGQPALAADALKSIRLAVCQGCEYNQAETCKACCGGTPIGVLVRLAASRCRWGKW